MRAEELPSFFNIGQFADDVLERHQDEFNKSAHGGNREQTVGLQTGTRIVATRLNQPA